MNSYDELCLREYESLANLFRGLNPQQLEILGLERWEQEDFLKSAHTNSTPEKLWFADKCKQLLLDAVLRQWRRVQTRQYSGDFLIWLVVHSNYFHMEDKDRHSLSIKIRRDKDFSRYFFLTLQPNNDNDCFAQWLILYSGYLPWDKLKLG